MFLCSLLLFYNYYLLHELKSEQDRRNEATIFLKHHIQCVYIAHCVNKNSTLKHRHIVRLITIYIPNYCYNAIRKPQTTGFGR